jgi:hypothetical protein
VGFESEGIGNTVDYSSKYRHCMFEIRVALWNWLAFHSAVWIVVCSGITVYRPSIIPVNIEHLLFRRSGELKQF